MQHLQPNTTLQGGKYRIVRMLGQGGFGITYLAHNTVFDIDVAIKEFFMKDENERDGNSVTMPNSTKTELFAGQKEKFKKEAKRMFAIKNEHIIGVSDLFEENGTAYYVMDYVDGENLAERLKRTGKPMSEQEVRELLPQILDALKSVHDACIWHLDLKPANIMVDQAGNVKLIDFGASKQLNAQKGGATTSTAISYTNGYAPREQMEQNYDKFGPWTDIYALGATLYNLLTNKRPPLPTDIDDDTSADKHIALPFPDSVSNGMKQCILRMMSTNRNNRPQNMTEVEAMFLKMNSGKLSDNENQKKNDKRNSEEDKTNFNNTEEEETIIAVPNSKDAIIGQELESDSQPQQTSASKGIESDCLEKTSASIFLFLIKQYWITAVVCLLVTFLFWYIVCGNPENFYLGNRLNKPINMLGAFYDRGAITLFAVFSVLLYLSFLITYYLKIPKSIVHLILIGAITIYMFITLL